MEGKDKKGFLILMAMLSEAFKEELSTERAKIYFEFLKEYSLNQLVWAVKRSIKELRWFPKVAELIEFINPSPYRDLTDPKLLVEGRKEENKKALEYIGNMAKIIAQKKDINKLVRLSYKDD